MPINISLGKDNKIIFEFEPFPNSYNPFYSPVTQYQRVTLQGAFKANGITSDDYSDRNMNFVIDASKFKNIKQIELMFENMKKAAESKKEPTFTSNPTLLDLRFVQPFSIGQIEAAINSAQRTEFNI